MLQCNMTSTLRAGCGLVSGTRGYREQRNTSVRSSSCKTARLGADSRFARSSVDSVAPVASVAADEDAGFTSFTSFPSQMLTSLALTVLVSVSTVPASLAVSGGGGMGTSLAFKDFSGQDLRGKNFNKADMRGIDLTNANMEGDQMFGAICADAKFNGANLRYADLESADLEGADLTGAVLEGAMLTNTQFKKLVSIEGADFTDALIRRDVQKGLCALPSAKGVNPVTGVDTRESLMCE